MGNELPKVSTATPPSNDRDIFEKQMKYIFAISKIPNKWAREGVYERSYIPHWELLHPDSINYTMLTEEKLPIWEAYDYFYYQQKQKTDKYEEGKDTVAYKANIEAWAKYDKQVYVYERWPRKLPPIPPRCERPGIRMLEGLPTIPEL